MKRGVMTLPRLNVHRHDRGTRALITLSGEIDLESAPLARTSLEGCLRDGIRTIDVDLASVTFCDCSGLNAFLHAARQTTVAGGTFQLHHPPTTLTRIIDLAGCGFLLLGLPLDHPPPPLDGPPAAPHRSVPLARVPSVDAP
ncbi:STAS domain-containing protein [Streptomyces sp. KMM 9044]|uniref:STAS domain-containing protein n=1 Tax=Streptomyces sp. KMM 9044 TaxID=2744474 RepID=UPI002F3FF5AF